MKISILLPFKENYSPSYPGAVSLFVNQITKKSKYKKCITIYGNTKFKKYLSNDYKNIPVEQNFFFSLNKAYIKSYAKIERRVNSDLIEIHNRPNYLIYLSNNLKNKNFHFFFHNDPLSMKGSITKNQRNFIVNKAKKIFFNSKWSRDRFLSGFKSNEIDIKKLIIVYQSTKKNIIDFKKKEKIITFVGKLNRSKGYDIFGSSIIKILDKYKNWRSIVIGDEPRDKLNFYHKNLKIMGFINHNKVLKIYKKTSISVVPSRWEEPFGRTALESASNGCALVISNKGGLPEAITNGIILKKLNAKNLYKNIEKLILNSKLRKKLQKDSNKNFFLTHKFVSNIIDSERDKL